MSTNPPPPNAGNIPGVTMSALLNVNYGTVSILVLWVYEYAITFDDEINFLRDSRWSIVKIIYVVCRYLMFPFVITNTLHGLQQGLTLEECESYFQFTLCKVDVTDSIAYGLTVGTIVAGATIIFCAELMFLVRTYALWHRSKAALVIIIINFTAVVVPMIVILTLFDSDTTMIPVSGITSCDNVSGSRVVVWAYVLLVIGEIEILLSTVYQAVRYYREVGGRNRLLAILVQHNTFYFCCSLGEHGRPASTFRASQSMLIDVFSIFRGNDFDDVFYSCPIHWLISRIAGSPTWDTSYSDAPFPVEFGPQEEASIKSK
ncbi:hypothetical protein PAXINDRAFT_15993 [Paxillus involutus ATCC 200175]|uniref:DUF6533 domain-containing protein n=1 Tax=Paxillus involutus ATCC 200175 TaxID=664439 RepID=A0A0C9TV09_PAXIN|nr:hypothetical protein PAXINDRAFT_15993 [Paxillus involutus ATCC 200175]